MTVHHNGSRSRWRITVGIAILGFCIASAIAFFVVATPSPWSGASHKQLLPVPSQGAQSSAGQPSATAPPLQHDVVPLAMATHLKIERDGEPPLLDKDIDPDTLQMETAGKHRWSVIPRKQPGVFIDKNADWSVLPGANVPGVGTTVIMCHAESDPPMVCNPLTTIDPDVAASSGYKAILTTKSGVLTYRLQDIPIKAKDELKNWDGLMTKKPNRLLVITCNLVDGKDTYDNRVLEFTLLSSVSN